MTVRNVRAELGSPPRETEATAQTWTVRILLLIGLVLSVVLPLTVGQSQIQDAKDLAHLGIVAQGRVVGKDSTSGKSTSYYLAYTFDSDRRTVSDRQEVSSDTYESYAVGDAITVTYVPGRDSVNRLGTVTDDDVASTANAWHFSCGAIFLVLTLSAIGLQRAYARDSDMLREGDCVLAEVAGVRKGPRGKNGTVWLIDYRYRASGGDYTGVNSVLNPSPGDIQIGATFPIVIAKYKPDKSKPLRAFQFAKVRRSRAS